MAVENNVSSTFEEASKYGGLDMAKPLDVLKPYLKPVKDALLALRQLVLDTARETDGVGPMEETLKWGHETLHRTGSQASPSQESSTKK